MESIVFITIFLALWHFFYEGVLAPSLRHGLRYKLFELRDRLRNLDNLTSQDSDIKYHLDHSICNIINSMSFLNLAQYFTVRKAIHSDAKLKNKLDEVHTEFSNTEDQQLQLIYQEMNKRGFTALVINHGGWFPYLILPAFIVIVALVVTHQAARLRNTIMKVVFRLINTSERFEDNQEYNLI